jgi:hypothetical protein
MLPNLIIIGAMKAGTTSLHYYLGLHPEVFMSRRKELDFFGRKPDDARDLRWYEAQFPSDARVRGESSPSYANHPRRPGVPERMHAVVPDAKLIYMVREPIARMASQYVHQCWMGNEPRSFEQAVRDERSSYVWRSMYYMQIEQFLPYYPRERILVISDEDLKGKPFETMRAVFRFLGVDESFRSEKFTRKLHRSDIKRQKTPFGMRIARAIRALDLDSGRLPLRTGHLELVLCYPFSRKIERPVVDGALRGELRRRLAPDLDALRRFTGRDFSEWETAAEGRVPGRATEAPATTR